METEYDPCCAVQEKNSKGFLKGLLYGVFPHTFCIGFILFSVIGSVTATAFLQQVLIIPYFLTFLVAISFLVAIISAILYLKKIGCLCASGVKRKWKYLAVLFSTIILVNWALFAFVFPAAANADSYGTLSEGNYNASLSAVVNIPCSGHASLIIGELKKNKGVGQVIFKSPNIFNVKYNPEEISTEKIFSSEVFNTYKATIK